VILSRGRAVRVVQQYSCVTRGGGLEPVVEKFDWHADPQRSYLLQGQLLQEQCAAAYPTRKVLIVLK
jgi:hypothetical protein